MITDPLLNCYKVRQVAYAGTYARYDDHPGPKTTLGFIGEFDKLADRLLQLVDLFLKYLYISYQLTVLE